MQNISRAEAKALGLARFFTAAPCVRGHLCERRVCNGRCVDCDRETSQRLNAVKASDPDYIQKNRARAAAWQKANKARYRENQQRWREGNIEKRRDDGQRRREANPGEFREWLQRRLETDPDFHKKRYARRKALDPDYVSKKTRQSAQWRRENVDRRNAAHRAWREANPERWSRSRRAAGLNRIARKKGNGGQCTTQQIAEILARQNGRCAGCGKRCKLEIDHIVPIARGGPHEPANLQGLCRSCNARKQAKDPFVWAREQGRLL